MAAEMGKVYYASRRESPTYALCAKLLEPEGISCVRAQRPAQLVEDWRKEGAATCAVVILELDELGLTDESVVSAVKDFQEFDNVEVLALEADPTVERMLEALKAGAYEYRDTAWLEESPEEFRRLVRGICIEERAAEEWAKAIQDTKASAFVGRSPEILQAVAQAARVVHEDAVLYEGESGAGKSFLARTIHEGLAPGRAEHFVRVDCGAMAESLFESELFGWVEGSFTGATETRPGLFELANGGVLFLDEIGNLAIPQQQALLRVLETDPTEDMPYRKCFVRIGHQEVTVDTKVVAATHYDLKKLIQEERFLEALYFRVSRHVVHIPPLRERPDDIPHIARRLLLAASKRMGRRFHKISTEAIQCLKAYPWPGNVRELSSVIDASVRAHRGTVIAPEHLPAHVSGARGAAAGTAVYGQSLVYLKTGVARSELDRLAAEFPKGHVQLPGGMSAGYSEVVPGETTNVTRLAKRLKSHRGTMGKRLREDDASK